MTTPEQLEHREQWVEALLSGKYPQGKSKLKSGPRYCCLGVACEISGLGEWSTYDSYIVGAERSPSVLPQAVADWLGLYDRQASYYDFPPVHGAVGVLRQRALTSDNDNGANFEEIAAIIESEPEGMFLD